jgi:hypothetical protein
LSEKIRAMLGSLRALLRFLELAWNCFHICLPGFQQTCYERTVGVAKPAAHASAPLDSRPPEETR